MTTLAEQLYRELTQYPLNGKAYQLVGQYPRIVGSTVEALWMAEAETLLVTLREQATAAQQPLGTMAQLYLELKEYPLNGEAVLLAERYPLSASSLGNPPIPHYVWEERARTLLVTLRQQAAAAQMNVEGMLAREHQNAKDELQKMEATAKAPPLDYKVPTGSNLGKLEEAVRHLMSKGYRPQGGIFVDGPISYQAMVRGLLLLLACVLGLAAVEYKEVPVAGLTLSPLLPPTTVIPQSAKSLTVGSEVYYFFDNFTLMAIKGENFVVQCPDRLLLPNGQWLLDKATGNLTRDELPNVAAEVLRDCALVTRLRIREGLRPVWINDEYSRGCNLHAEYLRLNPMKASLNMHREDPTKPGYTEEGKIGGGAMIHPTPRSMELAIMGWYRTIAHSTVITGPQIVSIKVGYGRAAALMGNVNIDRTVPERILHPQDGAINIPVNFSPGGEIPDPIPGDNGSGRGCPIYFTLDRKAVPRDGAVSNHPKIQAVSVVDNKGRTVAGKAESPGSKGNPTGHSMGGMYFFLPDRPLTPRTLYRVSFTLTNGHAEAWSFTTGDK